MDTRFDTIATRFERQFRTPHSEGYYITQESERIGHLDLHYAHEVVYGTLILDQELGEEEITELIELIDEELVMTADVEREDFMVSVYQGKDVGFYSDEYFEEEEEEDEELEEEDEEEDEEESKKRK